MKIVSETFRKLAGKANKDTCKKIVSCVLFLCIAGFVFTRVTYLFREVNTNRVNITGIKEEEQLDVVYIGGSAAFVYWQPLKAWNDIGLVSYSYASNSLQAESIKFYMKEVLKTQTPQLFVIDLRPFQYWDADFNMEVRNSSDSMDYTMNRLEMISSYFKNRAIQEEADDIMSYYLEIAKYHTNLQVLSNPYNWEYINNTGQAVYKGWEWFARYQYLEEPENFLTEERADLEEGCEKILENLLEFCQEKELQVLFVVCPYQITEEHQEIYNALQDKIEAAGFQYLNANEYYEEIGIDFATDFYNASHVNCFGAEKYTEFLENYLKEYYDLPDRRDDPIYADWNEIYQAFVEEGKEIKQNVSKRIESRLSSIEIAEELSAVTDAVTWSLSAVNENWTVFIETQGKWKQGSSEYLMILENLGIGIQEETGGIIQVIKGNSSVSINGGNISGASVQYSVSEESIPYYEGTIASEGKGETQFELGRDGNKSSIKIDGVEYSQQQDGVNIVLYDNNRKVLVDSVTLMCKDENVIIVR